MRLVHYRYKPEFAASAGIEATAPETGRDRAGADWGPGTQKPRVSVTSPPVTWKSYSQKPLLLTPGTAPLGIMPSRSPAPQTLENRTSPGPRNLAPLSVEIRESRPRDPRPSLDESYL